MKYGLLRPCGNIKCHRSSEIPQIGQNIGEGTFFMCFSLACYSTKVNMNKRLDSFGGLTCEFRKASYCDLKSTKVSQIQERWTKLPSVI